MISGGTQNDTIWGDWGIDYISGGDGDDILRGGDGDDTIEGDTGNDRIAGENGNDILRGGTGEDWLCGDNDTDTIYGQDNDDVLWAGDDYSTGEVLNGGPHDAEDTCQVGAGITDYGCENRIPYASFSRPDDAGECPTITSY